MHIQAPVHLFIGFWAIAHCAPLNAGTITSFKQSACIGAKAQAIAAPQPNHLVESSSTQSLGTRDHENSLRDTNNEIEKRQDEILTKIVKYTDDEMKNGADNEIEKRQGKLLPKVVAYADDEIIKSGDGKVGVANGE